MLRRGPRRWILAYATVEMALPFPLIAAGEQHVDSSVAAIVIATVPLLIALLALRFDHTERPTRTRMVGMLIGLAGVVALVGIDLSANTGEILGAAAVMVAALGYAAGPMIIKRHLVELRPARHDGGEPDGRRRCCSRPPALLTFPSSAPPADATRPLIVLLGVALHRDRVRDPDGAGHGGRRRARVDHHLRESGGRGGARRRSSSARARAPGRSPGCC